MNRRRSPRQSRDVPRTRYSRLFALAAPVMFEHGNVFLTIGIVGMSARMHARFEEAEMATFVKTAAAKLSHLLSRIR